MGTLTSRRRRRKTSQEERICGICSQSFKKAEHLARHLRSHTKEKPFHCSTCGKAYAREDTLLRHSRLHQESTLEDYQGSASVAEQSKSRSPVQTQILNQQNAQLQSVVPEPTTFRTQSLRQPHPARTDTANPLETSTLPIVTENGINDTSATFPLPLPPNELPSLSNYPPELWDTTWNDPLSWLTGTEFDLESVNLSLLQTIDASQPQEVTSTSPQVDAGSLQPARPPAKLDIQRKWHTFSDSQSAKDDMPDNLRGCITTNDAAYRRELAERLRPRVQSGILPSTTFLDLCIQSYFTQFHPILPLVHAPTFRPSTQNAALLLSMCSIGSLFLGSPRAVAHGISMFERLNKAMLSSWDTNFLLSGASNLMVLQAATIGQTFGLLAGRPKDFAGTEVFHGGLVAWARKARLFRHPDDTIPDLRNLADEALDTAWHQWVVGEEKKRFLLCLHIHDTELAKMNHHEPLLRHSYRRLPQLDSDELFAATSAAAWKECWERTQTYPLSALVTESSENPEALLPHCLNTFQLYTMLESIYGMTLEDPEAGNLAPQAAASQLNRLSQWHQAYTSSAAHRRSDPFCMLILWHSAHMRLTTDFNALECACGRDGEAESEKHQAYATTWARSEDARRCLSHALLIVRSFEALKVGAEPAIHVPTALYFCGIAWTAYALFGQETRVEEPQFPELQPFGMNGTTVFADIARVIRWGTPESPPLFRLIDCLQNIKHWTVAQSFASTLLALLDETQEFF